MNEKTTTLNMVAVGKICLAKSNDGIIVRFDICYWKLILARTFAVFPYSSTKALYLLG